MRRGFIKWAEEQSVGLRREMRIPVDAALPARRLAQHREVMVLGVEDIPDFDICHVQRLLNGDESSWSAFTLEADNRRFVVHNTNHSPARQESNIMHEMAHILCNHPRGKVLWLGPFCLRHYDLEEEEEAGRLGGILQVPRRPLLWLAREGLSVSQLAAHFGASEKMIRKRLNKGGVNRQLRNEHRSVPR